WRANGPRGGAPHGVLRARGPENPAARLDLEAAEVVVLELGSHGDPEAVRDEREFVLHEGAEEVEIPVGRIEPDARNALGPIAVETVAEAPDDCLPRGQPVSVLEIEVAGVLDLEEARVAAVRMVIVRLEREVRARAEAARPAAEKVGAREVGVLGQDGPEGGPEDRHRGPLPALPRIDVSLNAERIARARVPVRPESALPRPPGVVLGAARIEAGVTVEPLAVAPIVEVLADAPPVADAAEGALLGAAASGREAALRLSRALRDDVDHAVDGVGAPERA